MTFHFCLCQWLRVLNINLNYQKFISRCSVCFNKNIMFCRKSADLNDFSLKLMKYIRIHTYAHRNVYISGTPSGTS